MIWRVSSFRVVSDGKRFGEDYARIDPPAVGARLMKMQIGARIANGAAASQSLGARLFLFNDKLLTVLKVVSVFIGVTERTTNQRDES